jgi:uncharacterized protein YdeI (YjbR/CyaY-like superfamily)
VSTSYPQLEVTSRAQWRAWLAEHHASSPGVWLVTARRGRPLHLPYEDVVEEALCFGWIDSQAKALDADRGEQLMTPRRPTGTWALSNKARVERLTAAGLMAPAGLAVVEAAKASGAWMLLDDVEHLRLPEDLRAALDAAPAAKVAWDGFPPSARKQLLYWVLSAKREATRSGRVAQVVSEAAQGRRAHEPRRD